MNWVILKKKTIYMGRAQAIKRSINEYLIDSKTGLYIDGLAADGQQSTHASQQANMLPVAVGIVPEDNYSVVKDYIKVKGMSSGMVTLPLAYSSCGCGERW